MDLGGWLSCGTPIQGDGYYAALCSNRVGLGMGEAGRPFLVAATVDLLGAFGARVSHLSGTADPRTRIACPQGRATLARLWGHGLDRDLPGRTVCHQIDHPSWSKCLHLSIVEWGLPVAVLALCIVLVVKLRRDTRLVFVAGWILISLGPVMSLESVGQNVFAERYLYIPSAGFCLFLAILFEDYCKAFPRRIVTTTACAIVVTYVFLTVTRNPIWHDDKTFNIATLADSPYASKLHQNLGILHYKEAKLPAALGELAAEASCARLFVPSPYDTYNALIGIATVHLDCGHLDDAWQYATEASSLDAQRGEAYFIMGTIRSRQERDTEAEALLKRAVSLKPSDISARVNLGSVLLFRRKPTEAREQFSSALKLDSHSVSARLGLAMSLEQLGSHNEARALVNEVLAEQPGNADALRLLNQLGLSADPAR